MYGHEFKELRKVYGISQKKVCQGICSESKLSRWENDQVEVEFSTAIKLLNRIHLDSDEFLGLSEFAPKPNISPELRDALNSDSIPIIKRVTKKQIAQYHKSHDPFDLFVSATLCNQLLILDHKNYLPQQDLQTLTKKLSNVNFWSRYYISLFGSCAFLLSPKQLYGISMQIIRNFDQIEDVEVALGSLEDATMKLICQKDLDHAQKLIVALSKIDLPQYMMFFSLTLSFLTKLINYVKTGDEQPILSLINTLLNLNCSVQAATYLDMFKYLQAFENRK